jgi:hypothetical protein
MQYGYCPHFIMKHNLMRNKFSLEHKWRLLDRIHQIFYLHGCALLGVAIDELGSRLQMKINVAHSTLCCITSAGDISRSISGDMTYQLALDISLSHQFILEDIYRPDVLNERLSTLTTIYWRGSCLERVASCIPTPLICSTLGTMKAPSSIYTSQSVSPEALTFLLSGIGIGCCIK